MLLGEAVGISICWKRGERSRIRQRKTLGWDAGLTEAPASLARSPAAVDLQRCSWWDEGWDFIPSLH